MGDNYAQNKKRVGSQGETECPKQDQKGHLPTEGNNAQMTN